LENVQTRKNNTGGASRFSVQYVIRPQSEKEHDYRGYAGKISSGVYSKGDAVRILPSGLTTRIKTIEVNREEVESAFAGQSVVLHLHDNLDVSRGDAIIKIGELPRIENEFDVLMCWMDNEVLLPGNKYIIQHGSRRIKAVVKKIEYKLNVDTLERQPLPAEVKLNDVIKATIKTAEPLSFDSYQKLPTNGTAILIDQTSHMTVGACLIQ
jgi:sulfate adenylyltransferase subunit 1